MKAARPGTSRPRLARASRKMAAGRFVDQRGGQTLRHGIARVRPRHGGHSGPTGRPCRDRWPQASGGQTGRKSPRAICRSRRLRNAVGTGKDEPIELAESGQGRIDRLPIGWRRDADGRLRNDFGPQLRRRSANGSRGSSGRVTITRSPESGCGESGELFAEVMPTFQCNALWLRNRNSGRFVCHWLGQCPSLSKSPHWQASGTTLRAVSRKSCFYSSRDDSILAAHHGRYVFHCRRRLLSPIARNSHKIGDGSRLLQPYFRRLIALMQPRRIE